MDNLLQISDLLVGLYSSNAVLFLLLFVLAVVVLLSSLTISVGKVKIELGGMGQKSIAFWIIAITGFLAAIASVAMMFIQLFSDSKASFGKILNFEIFNYAYAQTASTQPIQSTSLVNYIVGGIFIVIFLTFVAAVMVMLFTKNEDVNKRKLAAADNIIKTFGGFFIGVATSFANQAIGTPV